MPERGGRRKIYYTISKGGHLALAEAYKLQVALWDGVAAFEKKNRESA